MLCKKAGFPLCDVEFELIWLALKKNPKSHLLSAESRKYLIISPINEYGGVNMDVAFLAQIIAARHQVKVISLGDFYATSSVYVFDHDLDYDSLDKMIYKDDALVQWITWAVSWMKPMDIPDYFRVENAITRFPLINIRRRKLKKLKKNILKADTVVLCSQLTSNFMKEAVEFSYAKNKKVFFRTTGKIHQGHLKDNNADWFNKVTTFIHHSKKNRERLFEYTGMNNHAVVDQNAYFENRLLDIPVPIKPVKRYFTLSRLHPSKQIDVVIKAFMKEADEEDQLTIYGSGTDQKRLETQAFKQPNIHFEGPVDFQEIPRVFRENDCLIISSQYEAGPYTGVESMAAATPIISTRVGAMEERLEGYTYFYDGSSRDLAKMIRKMKSLYSGDVQSIGSNLRARYLENYSEEQIRKRYEEILF